VSLITALVPGRPGRERGRLSDSNFPFQTDRPVGEAVRPLFI
jgi:hypothetical protein